MILWGSIMQFLLIRSKKCLNSEIVSKIKLCFKRNHSIFTDSKMYEWFSTDKKSFFICIFPDLYIYEKFKTFYIDESNNLYFIHGWLKKAEEDNLLNISDFDDDFSSIDGYFNMGIIGDDGICEIKTSKVSPAIFYAKSDEFLAISNRIFMLSDFFSYKKINKKHVATHIQYQEYTISFDTIFENIFVIPFGSNISISDDLYIERDYDYLYDKRLEELYVSDKDLYWDECFLKLKSQAKAFFNLVGSDKLKCSITGGKDSRLLLSIYCDYVDSAFTFGPVFSPEVIVGEMICNTLNLNHVIDNTLFTNKYPNLMRIMPYHIFEREFEICPWDFGGRRRNNVHEVLIGGHEFVKVRPFQFDDKEEIKNHILEGFNNNFAINDNYNDLIREDASEYVDEFLNEFHHPSKFAIIKRTLERGRWVAKGHESDFINSFIIFPLLSNVVLTYAYNIPKERIYLEEFHYEILKRANSDLLDIPLFGTHFDLNQVPPVENKIPGKLNYKNAYLLEYYDYIMEYITENFSLISDIVKKEFIEGLTKDKLFNNQKVSSVIYNILQYLVLLKTDDSANLTDELDFDWKIDVENKINDESLDFLTLKAFVEYNKDIVNFKKQLNISAMEKYNTCRIDFKNKGFEDNNVEIIEISDSSARYNYPSWFKDEFGEGLKIESNRHVLNIDIKCIGDGELNISLKSLDIRNDSGEKIPIYINYNKFCINDEIIFDKQKLVWHDDSYNFKLNVRDNDIIRLNVEWEPF